MIILLYTIQLLLLLTPSHSKPRTVIFGVDGLSSLFIPIPNSVSSNSSVTLNSSSPSNIFLSSPPSSPSSSSSPSPSYSSISFLLSEGSFVSARTVIEAVSGPGWIANFCSLDSSSSGITWNTWNSAFPPIRKSFPCLFEALKKVNDKLKVFYLYSWNWLGEMASNLTTTRFCESHEAVTTFLCDRILTEEALRIIRTEDDWDVLVLYLNGVDEAGHTFTWGSPQYKEAIGMVDNHIGKVIDLLKKKNLFPETTILLTSDHGGSIGTVAHGSPKDDNLEVPWIMVGPKIKKNHHLTSNVHNIDGLPTLFHAMGWKRMREWRGKVIQEVFEGKNI